MKLAALILADRGDAELVKLIAVVIFAAISIIGNAIKKAADRRKAAGQLTKPVAQTRSPREEARLEKARRMAKGDLRRPPKPLRASVPLPVPIARVQNQPLIPQPAAQPAASPAARPATRRKPSLRPENLRDAIIWSEIISPPLALRRDHLETAGSPD